MVLGMMSVSIEDGRGGCDGGIHGGEMGVACEIRRKMDRGNIGGECQREGVWMKKRIFGNRLK